ncbi:MAG: HIT domain-containing protein [Candidatus Taylorbacteria bacterium]|nr:HIT domain-containing protein [Candidatus Taylorbacteria bacterium]
MDTKDFYCDFVLNNKISVIKEAETATVLAFRHTRPSWTLHIVIVPKQHVVSISDMNSLSVIEEIFSIAKDLINKYNLNSSNYKIITNGGEFQDSKHLHFHLVSGSQLL